jgi:hypothetical protein
MMILLSNYGYMHAQTTKETRWNTYIEKFKSACRAKNSTQVASLSGDDFFSGECFLNDYHVSIYEWTSYVFSNSGQRDYVSFMARLKNPPRDENGNIRVLGGKDICNPRFEYDSRAGWKFLGFRSGYNP